MQERNFAPDFNVGQLVQGSVYANNLVLNIGGEPCPLWEVESGKVAELRDTLGVVLTARRVELRREGQHLVALGIFLAMLAVACLGGTHAMWLVGESYVALLVLSALVVFSSLVLLLAGYRGQRRPRRAIAYLEDIQARLDAELDIRSWGFGGINR